jgi:predicted RNase H-like nuclease (RuvC/YqgF family)
VMYEELVENLKSLRENYFQTQDDDNFCFSAVDADMLESAAEVIEDLELVSRSQQAACNQLAEAIEKLQSELEHLKNCRHECKIDCLLKEYNKKCNELEQVKAEREAAVKELKGCCAFCKFNQPGIRGISTECVKCLETNGDRPNWEWRGVQGGKDD